MRNQIRKFIASEISFSPRTLRLGLILGLIIYGAFGYLDLYMMPSNYKATWIIRYAVVIPLVIATFFLSYYKSIYRYNKIILFLLLSMGQIGIIVMIGISIPGDPAFYTYYAGLILIMLWATFVFMLNFITTVYIAVSTVVLYNLTAIFQQNLLSYPSGSNESSFLMNNNFFLISAAGLVIIGAYQLNRQEKEIKKVHDELLKEKIQLELAKEKAEESDRLKSAFLANMSHELRTPLNSIIGFSDLILDPDFDFGQHLDFARLINGSGCNLLAIITDIMDISKIEAGQVQVKKRIFSVGQLVASIQKEYSFKAVEKGIVLRLDALNPVEDVCIESDETKTRQILVNFVGNAIKFTQKGSIEIGFKTTGDYLQFQVKDTGIGIPTEFHEKIFERFRQVESAHTRKYGGNGLGLPISKSLVELLGGKIWLESEQGKGSTFYFTIPKIKSTP